MVAFVTTTISDYDVSLPPPSSSYQQLHCHVVVHCEKDDSERLERVRCWRYYEDPPDRNIYYGSPRVDHLHRPGLDV